jgi:hypothetical protein
VAAPQVLSGLILRCKVVRLVREQAAEEVIVMAEKQKKSKSVAYRRLRLGIMGFPKAPQYQEASLTGTSLVFNETVVTRLVIQGFQHRFPFQTISG